LRRAGATPAVAVAVSRFAGQLREAEAKARRAKAACPGFRLALAGFGAEAAPLCAVGSPVGEGGARLPRRVGPLMPWRPGEGGAEIEGAA
jgi:hypothetical protein